MAKLISKAYGEALYELAKEKKIESALLEEVTALKTVLKDNPELSDTMRNPRLSKEEKLDLLNRIFENRLSEHLLSFLCILVEKNRYSDADAIFDYFTDRIKEDEGIGTAYVTTAFEPDAEMKKKIYDKLLQSTSFNKLEVVYTVDEEIIGGMVVRIRDRVVDSSIRTKLVNMERELHKVML